MSIRLFHNDYKVDQGEINFIQNNFKIRTCFKFSGANSDECKCKRKKYLHTDVLDCHSKWSYTNNTLLESCSYYGKIIFHGCDDLCREHRFIRFNVIEDTLSNTYSLPFIVEAAYTLIDQYWNVQKPKLIISVIGGFKRMNISNQQKKNFKQGLIDVMKKDRTLIIAGGFNVGVHKLVSETVREFRIYHEHDLNHVHLIGISTWGVVWANESLGLSKKEKDRSFTYPNGISREKGKVALDPNCDCFFFCDDGTERTYDKEVDFRMKFEKYAEDQAEAFAVQILFEGGYRAVFRAHETLRHGISIVVLKGSGRAADIISEVMELRNISLEGNIAAILEDYKVALTARDEDLPQLKSSLMDMYKKYNEQIVVYDMVESKLGFGEMIVEAIISGQTGKSLKEKLELTIRFNCAHIAQDEVFSNPDFSKISYEEIKCLFIDVLKDNKYQFATLFLDNDIEIDRVVTKETLCSLYEESRKIKKCQYAELLNDLVTPKGSDKSQIYLMGKIISILSGNILQRFYTDDKGNDQERFGIQDLFLWALLSGHTELAEIFWRFGKCHVSSALIGSTILKNMAYYILKLGDSELQKKLIEASNRFEKLAFDILTKAYNEKRKKTCTILIRELKTWNNTTCFRIALNGNLLEFLSHSACRSYTTQVWMGGLSPFLSLWKILLTIPFSFCLMYHLIMPSFHQNYYERSGKRYKNKTISNPRYSASSPEECKLPLKRGSINEEAVTFWKAMSIFYSAPIVKFYINFASYIFFLIIFAYMNLVELKPRNYINTPSDMAAEIFVYGYLITFVTEEVRQITEQNRSAFFYKLQAYLSGSCNKLDVFIILTFVLCTFVRFILPEDIFMVCRCLFSICFCMFSLRTMQFYFAYEFVGPKVIMIWNMLRDIIFFLSIFALFIVSYGTLSHSIRSPNSPLDIFLIKDIIQNPYFQTYGELMLDKLFHEDVCNTTNCHFQQTTVVVGFAAYLLMTNILLVNLLIAMFGYTFNQIQDKSGKYWLFIKLQLVEEFYTKPILSPPLNVFYYIYYFIILMIRWCRCRREIDERRYDDLLLTILPGNENLKITGFEQLCMEASLEDLQCHVDESIHRTSTDGREKPEYRQKSTAGLGVQENQEVTSNRSFQVRCDKRFDKLEKSIDKLISRENT